MPREQPHALLDREAAIRDVARALGKHLELLRDMTNYGSNLVVRAYHSSPMGMSDLVVCGVLLKQVVAMLDSVEVLLSAGTAHGAHLPARAAFEASAYLEWILVSDSDRKARCY